MRWDWFVFTCAVMGFLFLMYGSLLAAEESYTLERDFWQKDSYVVRDESGEVKARVEKSFWREDSYTVRDDSGRAQGHVERDNFWRDE